MLEIAIIAHGDGGFGYEIRQDGAAIIAQPFNPDLPGSVPMSREEAESKAAVVLARLET